MFSKMRGSNIMSEVHADHSPVLAFGPFRFFPDQRALYRAGTPLRLGSRAREILFTLVERAGETVKKSELMARVWPDIVVEDGALRVHISALRKALGGGTRGSQYVETINGHGYRLNARVQRVGHFDEPASDRPERPALIGREHELASVISRLRLSRIVTLVGPPGVGKSSLAAAAEVRLRAGYVAGSRTIDIAAIHDAAGVAEIASQLQRPEPVRDSARHVAAAERLLVVLDNCDPLIEATAALVEHLINTTAHIDILVTSREPLHAFGESLLRIHPLALPKAMPAISPDGALDAPAVRLFVERASASDDRFHLSSSNVSKVVEICAKLDGLPLAIELVAAHMCTLGVMGLAGLSEELLCALPLARRTAVPRHRSLRAALDWSFVRLSEDERAMLGVLVEKEGVFDFPQALSSVSGSLQPERVTELFTRLAEKSLIVPVPDAPGPGSHFRVLATTRACARTHGLRGGE